MISVKYTINVLTFCVFLWPWNSIPTFTTCLLDFQFTYLPRGQGIATATVSNIKTWFTQNCNFFFVDANSIALLPHLHLSSANLSTDLKLKLSLLSLSRQLLILIIFLQKYSIFFGMQSAKNDLIGSYHPFNRVHILPKKLLLYFLIIQRHTYDKSDFLL